MVDFGLPKHYLILEKLCQTCGERLKKAKDKYENSFLGADKREIIFTAFGVKMRDDRDTCPPKFSHKCYKPASRGAHVSQSMFGLHITNLATVLYAVPTRTNKSLEGKENPNLD